MVHARRRRGERRRRTARYGVIRPLGRIKIRALKSAIRPVRTKVNQQMSVRLIAT